MPGETPAKQPTTLDGAVGNNVRVWRMARGLSQDQLSRSLDVTFQQLQKYEDGVNRIPTGRLVQISRILDAPVELLLDSTEPTATLISLIRDARAFRLASAFAGITDASVRLSLVSLVEGIAANQVTLDGAPS